MAFKMLNPLIRVSEQGHVQVLLVFAHIVSEYEISGCVSTFVASCVAVVVSFLWRWALTSSYPAACEHFVRLFDTDICWHLPAVELWVASVLPGFFLQPDDFAHDLFALYGGVGAFAGVPLLSHRQPCSALFKLLLKTELRLVLVRFWCFLICSIHRAVRFPNSMRARSGLCWTFPPKSKLIFEMASCLVPSLLGEGIIQNWLTLTINRKDLSVAI